MVGDHEAAGAIPVTQTNECRPSSRTPSWRRSQPRPLAGRSSMLIVTSLMPVQVRPLVHNATVPRNGTRFCEDRRQRFNSSRWHQRSALIPPRGPYTHLFTERNLWSTHSDVMPGSFCVAVWDGTGFQLRLSSVRFAGGVRVA